MTCPARPLPPSKYRGWSCSDLTGPPALSNNSSAPGISSWRRHSSSYLQLDRHRFSTLSRSSPGFNQFCPPEGSMKRRNPRYSRSIPARLLNQRVSGRCLYSRRRRLARSLCTLRVPPNRKMRFQLRSIEACVSNFFFFGEDGSRGSSTSISLVLDA